MMSASWIATHWVRRRLRLGFHREESPIGPNEPLLCSCLAVRRLGRYFWLQKETSRVAFADRSRRHNSCANRENQRIPKRDFCWRKRYADLEHHRRNIRLY